MRPWTVRGNVARSSTSDARAGLVCRVLDDLVQIETFSGDYGVTHWVKRGAIRHVFSATEIAEAMRP